MTFTECGCNVRPWFMAVSLIPESPVFRHGEYVNLYDLLQQFKWIGVNKIQVEECESDNDEI